MCNFVSLPQQQGDEGEEGVTSEGRKHDSPLASMCNMLTSSPLIPLFLHF